MQDTQQQRDQQWEEAQKLKSKALNANSWIFHMVSREWYSPEEFFAKFSNQEFKQGWIKEFNVLFPINGLVAADELIKKLQVNIQAENEQIQKIQEKKSDLQKRVFSYYQDKLRV